MKHFFFIFLITLGKSWFNLNNVFSLFQLITALTYHDYEFESALKVYNVSKNRVGGTLPGRLI